MTEPSATPPQAAPRKASRARIIVMLLLGGPVLAVGGCALFLANVNFNSGGADNALSVVGAIGFIAGALAFVVGGLWGLIVFVNSRFNSAKPQ
jgi:hypothetical protein